MNYNYTAYYKTDEERIEAIKEDILKEYPKLGDLAIEAAKMETPFGRVHDDYDRFSDQENHINRLINIIIVTENKPELQEEYQKACADLISNYDSWKRNFTYANPQEQAVSGVMIRFYEHQKDKSIPLITYGESKKMMSDLLEKKERKQQSLRLKSIYPLLGEEITDKVIDIERDSRIWMRFQENDIIRLVMIIKLIEDKEEYKEAYTVYLAQLNEMYEEWQKYEGKSLTQNQKLFVEMMNRFYEHLKNKEKPISTYVEIKEEMSSKENNGGMHR